MTATMLSYALPRASSSRIVSSTRCLHTTLPTLSGSIVKIQDHPTSPSRKHGDYTILQRKVKFRMVKRERRRRDKEVLEEWYDTAPSVFLGVPQQYSTTGVPLHTLRWRQTKLASVLLSPKVLWSLNPQAVLVNDETISSLNSTKEEEKKQVELNEAYQDETAEEDGKYLPPRYLNFGISKAEKKALFETLPALSAQRQFLNEDDPAALLSDNRFEKAELKERENLEAFGKILDLRNASSKEITKSNKARVIEAFSMPKAGAADGSGEPRKGPDTGSPEVQIALLTARIHQLYEHCLTHKKDVASETAMFNLTQKRAKRLRHLKSLDWVRYEKALADIGVDKRAVEGRVIIPAGWRDGEVYRMGAGKYKIKGRVMKNQMWPDGTYPEHRILDKSKTTA